MYTLELLFVPYPPHQLMKKETLDSLSHWQTSVKNYFRRFSDSAEFFKWNSTWTQGENYGFKGPGANDKADNLEALLDTIASFLPCPYITHKITKTMTCISSVWDTTFNHYGVKPSTSSFLDYEDIKYNREDRYIDLYDKLVYHVMNHLCPAGTSNPNSSDKVLPTADTLTLSHRNNIAMDWLRKIVPALIKIVSFQKTWRLESH